ncbi:anti-sigma factor [Streptomyces tropicalis]|uniref:Regulator of SigK n=1 Tax=Streptomyces tropicalis TaxID=3034234 RepID=A0ABT6AA43_9ACTN|nr:anti-sigma factor [Streptomyces tropicalis]MDF3301323.1 anti-sigma factor [Streptomyces tropicalis]
MITADLHTLTGAYALHSLPDDERVAFERHLADCEACTREVEEFAATAARLGLAVTAPARPAMKDEVLRRIGGVRQDAPHTSPAVRSARAALRARRLSGWALAACVAAAAALGGTAVWQHQRAEDARAAARQETQRADEVAAVLAAPDARSRTARLAGGAGGTVVVSRSRDRAVFVASDMAAPPPGKVYQLWFAEGGAMRSAGLMDPQRASQTVVMQGPVDGASAMGITVEPRGGSRAPTSAPLALMNLPA